MLCGNVKNHPVAIKIVICWQYIDFPNSKKFNCENQNTTSSTGTPPLTQFSYSAVFYLTRFLNPKTALFFYLMRFFHGERSKKFFLQFFFPIFVLFLSTFVTFYYFGQVLNVKGDYCFQKRLTYVLPFFKIQPINLYT